MKKMLLIIILGALFISLAATGWSLAPVVSLDTITLGRDANGVITFSQTSLITIRVALVEPYSHQVHSSSRFSYYGIDTATGRGIDLGFFAAAGNGLDTAVQAVGFPAPGLSRVGTLMYAQGSVGQFNGLTELIFNPADTTAVQFLGSGFAVPTTLVSSFSAFTGYDQNQASGGMFYQGKLLRFNNVKIDAATITLSSTAGSNINVYDFSGVTVVMRVDGGAAGNGISAILIGQLGGTSLAAYTTGFDLIATGSIFKAATPFTSGFQPTARGLITDFVSTTINVSPIAGFTHPSGAVVNFTATGAMPPYTWSLSNGAIGSINSTSGVFTPGVTVGSSTVTATDFVGRTGTAIVSVTATGAPLAPDAKASVLSREITITLIKE